MSIAASLHRAHKARLARIASRAAPPADPPPAAPVPPRYTIDLDYELAWAAVILGWSGNRRFSKRRIEEIQHATAQHFGISREELLNDERATTVARPRHVAMFLARELTTKSFAEIGECFGGRDHSVVQHAVRRIRQRLAGDAELARSVDCIRAALDQL